MWSEAGIPLGGNLDSSERISNEGPSEGPTAYPQYLANSTYSSLLTHLETKSSEDPGKQWVWKEGVPQIKKKKKKNLVNLWI